MLELDLLDGDPVDEELEELFLRRFVEAMNVRSKKVFSRAIVGDTIGSQSELLALLKKKENSLGKDVVSGLVGPAFYKAFDKVFSDNEEGLEAMAALSRFKEFLD